jgi:hypothetical protein
VSAEIEQAVLDYALVYTCRATVGVKHDFA